MGYFAGKRTLTRYEFAVVLQRVLDKLQYSGLPNSDVPSATASPVTPGPSITADLVAQVQTLVAEFKADLAMLGTNLIEVNERLNQLEHHLQDVEIHTGNNKGQLDFHPAPSAPTDQSRFHLLGSESTAHLLDSVDFGLESVTHSFSPTLGPPTLAGQTSQAWRGPNSDRQRGSLLGMPDVNGLSWQNGPLGGQNTELHFALPLTDRGMLGVTMRDSLVADDFLAPNAYHNLAYGTSINVNPVGRLTLGAEALRSITELPTADSTSSSYFGNNLYQLKLAYNTGPANAVVGYRVGDTLGGMNSTFNLNRTLSGLNPANGVQGPYTQLAWRFSDRLQSYLGGDYYGNAGFRGSILDTTFSPLLTGNVYRGTAGIRWNPTRRISLTADFEGVLYDLSGAVSSSGRRLQPVEQYISLGAGLDLPGNAILRMAYRIYNQQDSLTGGDGFSNQEHASVFTTQLAIHF
jgi:hypothetical protein